MSDPELTALRAAVETARGPIDLAVRTLESWPKIGIAQCLACAPLATQPDDRRNEPHVRKNR